MPRLLQCLLAQLLPASCSEVNPKLLRLINEALVLCYNASVEEKAYAISILRSIGIVISTSNESGIVQFLSLLQQGISCWIADEEVALQENEHRELVCCCFTVLLYLFNSSGRWLPCIRNPWTFLLFSNPRSRFSAPCQLSSNPFSSACVAMDHSFFTTFGGGRTTNIWIYPRKNTLFLFKGASRHGATFARIASLTVCLLSRFRRTW